MLLSADTQNWLKAGLCEAVMLLCKSVLKFESQFSVEGLLAVTIDKNEVFLVNIKEIVDAENKNNGIETQSNGTHTKLRKRTADDKIVLSSNRSNDGGDDVLRPEQKRDDGAYNSGNIQAGNCDNTASNNIFDKLMNEDAKVKEDNIGVLMMDLSSIKTEVGLNDLIDKSDHPSFNNSFNDKTFHSELYHPRKAIKQKPQRREARAGCCENCGTTNTTTWRRSNDKELLCNACGCYYKLHGVHRPAYMAHNEIRSRTRRVKKSSRSSMLLTEKAFDLDLMLSQHKQQNNQQKVIKIQPQQDFLQQQQHGNNDLQEQYQQQHEPQDIQQQFQQNEQQGFLHQQQQFPQEYNPQNNYEQQQQQEFQQQQQEFQQQHQEFQQQRGNVRKGYNRKKGEFEVSMVGLDEGGVL